MNEVRRLGDRYQVGELLGRGGMAEVHEGQDQRLGRRVAIKILRPDLARDPAFLARFRREAQSAASLNHPNIVAVYDTGEDALASGSNDSIVPFIVMELVEGITLRELLRSGQPLVPERALEITSGVLAALDYSHRHGIVHRDIKPGNVMLTPTGTVKVMDFGIARATADAGVTGTSTQTVLGTAAYLSPEQAQGQTVDARSDLYSTGVVLFELLTRRPPFQGEAPVAIAFAHVNENPPAPSVVSRAVPAELDPLVLKAMAKEPGQRYQSAVEFRADVERAIAGVPVTSVMPTARSDGQTTTVLSAPDADATRHLGIAGSAVAAGATGAMPPVVRGGAGEPWSPISEPTQVTATQPARGGKGVSRALGILALVVGVVWVVGWLGMRLLSGSATPTMTVPDIQGLTVERATTVLQSAGLSLGREDFTTSDRPKDTIIDQSPRRGDLVAEGSGVNVTISAGREQVPVPDVVGFNSAADARRALEDAGLTLGRISEKSSDQAEGSVLSQNPAAFAEVDAGTAVAIVVSNALISIPNVVGRTNEQARRDLFEAGFEVAYGPEEPSATATPGTVVRQSPASGGQGKKGSTVTLVLATAAPTPTPTPTPEPTIDPSEAAATGGGADGRGGDGTAQNPLNGVTDADDNPGLSATPTP